MNKSKIFNYLFIALCFAISTSCGEKEIPDDGNGNDNGNNTGNNTATTISATGVINSSSKIATVKAGIWYGSDDNYYEVAKAAYKNNGFTMNLPANVASKYLDQMFDAEDGLTISDKSAKGCMFLFLDAFDKSDDEIGELGYLSADPSDDYNDVCLAMWLYVDKNVTVSGQTKDIDEEANEEYITKFDNFSLKKGWNMCYARQTYSYNQSTKKGTYTGTFSTQKPSGVTLKWYFWDYNEEDYAVVLKSAKSLPERKKITVLH